MNNCFNTKRALTVISFIFLSIGSSFASHVKSFRNDIFLNPTFAIGYDSQNRKISGFIEALRTSPGNTEACRLYFSGPIGDAATRAKVSVVEVSKSIERIDAQRIPTATIDFLHEHAVLSIKKNDAPGDCDFVLGFLETKESKDGLSYQIDLVPTEFGDWAGVGVVRSTRAPIFSSADETSGTRSFLIKGDRFYVLKASGSWVNFKFEGRKKTTVGWLKLSDTVQIQESN